MLVLPLSPTGFAFFFHDVISFVCDREAASIAVATKNCVCIRSGLEAPARVALGVASELDLLCGSVNGVHEVEFEIDYDIAAFKFASVYFAGPL